MGLDGEWVIGGSASKGEGKIYMWERAGHLVKILEGLKEALIGLEGPFRASPTHSDLASAPHMILLSKNINVVIGGFFTGIAIKATIQFIDHRNCDINLQKDQRKDYEALGWPKKIQELSPKSSSSNEHYQRNIQQIVAKTARQDLFSRDKSDLVASIYTNLLNKNVIPLKS
ncbi:unnamed protein product [Dovyalis caffra]|uniref:Uncharacterized protein n=1 Tax=Dovyalis caffra TaxID=77055 RepID=A0AAV1RBT9_9ROSI|nr:unnamed protein product [Dovyalis caffra]